MTQAEMAQRFTAYNDESNAFIFGDWAVMTIADREAKEQEINARHSYRHGWINIDGHSFNQRMAFPDREFVNVFD
jgi:hypothetical protein